MFLVLLLFSFNKKYEISYSHISLWRHGLLMYTLIHPHSNNLIERYNKSQFLEFFKLSSRPGSDPFSLSLEGRNRIRLIQTITTILIRIRYTNLTHNAEQVGSELQHGSLSNQKLTLEAFFLF